MSPPTAEQIYRRQRHLYDATRPLFLAGRDRMLDGVDAPVDGSVLEIGCGTARNLLRLGRRRPDWRLFGLDASPSMLRTAAARIPPAQRSRILLAEADAVAWNPVAAFGENLRFDAICFSYSLSMFRDPRRAIENSVRHLAPRGSLHLVDFGDDSIRAVPWSWGLGRWLRWWHVRPAADLVRWLESLEPVVEAAEISRSRFTVERAILSRGYAQIVRARARA